MLCWESVHFLPLFSFTFVGPKKDWMCMCLLLGAGTLSLWYVERLRAGECWLRMVFMGVMCA